MWGESRHPGGGRKQPSKHHFPPLDEEEQAWIERFNAGLKEPNLAEALFKAEVLVG